MARQPRFKLPGYPQHVIQRGNNRHVIFADAADFCIYRDKLAAACEWLGWRIHASVLMTNHTHLLISPDAGAGIGRVMQSLWRDYFQLLLSRLIPSPLQGEKVRMRGEKRGFLIT